MIKDSLLSTYAQEAYKDYAMYVLLDRALPRHSDGFKPVQRRIVFAMHELGLSSTSKPKKSVRTVGDVLGKFHPHSDQACYEAMVSLAQDFSTRYPILEGQGNFGSLDDPKSFAAMRYTEARLSKYADLVLDELSPSSVPWFPNFDGSRKEPLFLPAKLPILLLNGCSGIAVGMSTEIPPHNLSEVAQALIFLIDRPHASIQEILNVIKGPDFPTGGIIRAKNEDLIEFYKNGKGVFIVEGLIEQDGNALIIKEIPYYSTTTRIIEELQDLLVNKILPSGFELIDESDEYNPVRIVLNFKSAALAKNAVEILYQKTELRKSYRCYFNALNQHNRPTTFNISLYLNEWLETRYSVLKSQFSARIEAITLRMKIIHACMIVFNHLKEILEIIQYDDDPWVTIAKKFHLDKDQIDALAGLRLRQLTKLSFIDLKKELDSLSVEQEELTELITSHTKLKNFTKNQLKDINKKLADKRRTQILEPIILEKEILLNPQKKEESKPLTIVLSNLGWIKTAKGHQLSEDTYSFRQGDGLSKTVEVMSDDESIFVDDTGRFYSLDVDSIPSSRFGEHLSTLLKIPSGAHIISILNPHYNLFNLTSSGYGFIIDKKEFSTNKRGKNVVKLQDNELLSFTVESSGSLIALLTTDGKLGILETSSIPIRQTGRGVIISKETNISKIISLEENDDLYAVLPDNKQVKITIEDFIINRANKFKKLPKKFNGLLSIKKI